MLKQKGYKMKKFKCVECGENEIDNEDDICEECFMKDDNGDNSGEEDEE